MNHSESHVQRVQFVRALHTDEVISASRPTGTQLGDDDWQRRSSHMVKLWREYFADHDELLEKRLAHWQLNGLDEFGELLANSPDDLAGLPGLNFVEELDMVLRRWSKWPDVRLCAEIQEEWKREIGRIVAPIVGYRCERVRAKLAGEPVALSAALDFLAEVPVSLVETIVPIIALEVNIARVVGSIQHTGEDAFLAVVRNLASDSRAAADFFARYPVMTRGLIERSESWSAAAVDFGQRLNADKTELELWCADGSTLLPLRSVVHGAGDTHCGGRATAVVTLADGTKVAYKPRALGPAAAAREFMTTVLDADVPAMAEFIDREVYGWTKFVENLPCANTDELSRYYYNFGELTAVLWFLGASDFHSENVVACGTQPVLIDLETLLTAGSTVPDKWTRSGNPQVRRADLWWELPTAVGMLPFLSGGKWPNKGADLSVFGDVPGERYTHPNGTWTEAGTDQMRRDDAEIVRPKFGNRPWLSTGGEFDSADFHTDVLTGFRETLHKITNSFAAMSPRKDPYSPLAAAKFRSVMRPSAFYASLLREVTHPDFCQDAVYRDLHFEILWANCDTVPQSEALVGGELRDLREGDLPLHYSQADSTSVFDWDGTEHRGYFSATAVEKIRNHVELLDQDNVIERLTHSVELSLAAYQENRQLGQWDTSHVPLTRADIEDSELIASASAIGERLLDLGWPSEDGITWITASSSQGMNWDVRVVSDNLYDGTAGIGLFLEALTRVTGSERFHDAYRTLTSSWLRTLSTIAEPSVGGYEGLGGTLYRLALLSDVEWPERPELVHKVLDRFEEMLADEELGTDILGGSAGATLALCRSATRLDATGAARATEIAERFGNRLVSEAVPREHGMGWPRSAGEDDYLLGFSHGCAGIAYALRLLAGRLEDSYKARCFEELAGQAERLERTHYRASRHNWDDLRGVPGEGFSYSWCNGNVGIGVARAMTLRDCQLSAEESAAMRAEVAAALVSARKHSLGCGHTLCHGDMGATELFLQASTLRLNDGLGQEARSIAARVARQCLSTAGRAQSGHRWVREAPGLLNGSSGVGYQLLRVASPEYFPSILGLEVSPNW